MIKLSTILQEIQIKQANYQWLDYSVRLHIKNSPIHGKGLFTSHFIPNHHWVDYAGSAKEGRENTSYHANFINHSLNGNIKIVKKNDTLYIVSIRDIQENEELTTDYTKLPPPLDTNIEGFLNEIQIKGNITPEEVNELWSEVVNFYNTDKAHVLLIKYWDISNQGEKLVARWLKNLPHNIRYQFYKDLKNLKDN